MNNCPKCGNPLQAGVTSCPICGTNISSTNSQQPEGNKGPTPVDQQPATESKPNTVKVESVSSAPKVEQSASPTETQTKTVVENKQEPQVTKEPAPVATPVTPTVEPVATSPTPEQPVQEAPTPVKEATPQVQTPVQPQAPVAAPVENQSPATITQIAPTVQNTSAQTPVPSIPSSLVETDPVAANVAQAFKPTPEVKEKPKKKGKKGILLVAVVALLAVVGGVLYMNLSSKPAKPPVNPNPTNLAGTTAVSSNGYKFNLSQEWLINEDGSNVILTNTDETVAIKLDHSPSNISNITKEMIEKYINKSALYKDTTVSALQISAKDAYSINTYYNELPVQIYFIGGGTNLTLGITIVYQSDDTKSKYEATVTEMVGTISYSDESIKAISTMDMYSDIFNTYGGIINSQNTPIEEPTPETDPTGEEQNPNVPQNEPLPTDNPNQNAPQPTE